MADEHQFIRDGLQRSQIDEFFAEELGRAGYGGMEMAPTPMGMQIVLKAEKPGMVIGKGGKNIRKVTTQLEERFDLEDPQIDVQEVDEPDLNARIVADRLANALERGWYFRKAGHTTLERIMDAGALGAEIVLSGKVTGARSRVEKFNDGYIKHNGEPAETVVDHGQGVAVMKLGTIGVDVKIIPPGAELPDDFRIHDDADVSEVAPEAVEANEAAADLIEEPSDDDLAEIREDAQGDDDEETGAADDASAEPVDEEVVEEVIEEEVADEGADADSDDTDSDDAATTENADEPADDDVPAADDVPADADVPADDEVPTDDVDVPTDDDVEEELEDLDEAVEAEAEALMDEMDDEDEDTEE